MKTINIQTNGNGGYEVENNPIQLGGTHDHQLQWNNATDLQAVVTCQAGGVIFANWPASGSIVVGGGGHVAPKPSLVLLPHDQRQNGTFEYGVAIGGTTVPGTLQIHP